MQFIRISHVAQRSEGQLIASCVVTDRIQEAADGDIPGAIDVRIGLEGHAGDYAAAILEAFKIDGPPSYVAFLNLVGRECRASIEQIPPTLREFRFVGGSVTPSDLQEACLRDLMGVLKPVFWWPPSVKHGTKKLAQIAIDEGKVPLDRRVYIRRGHDTYNDNPRSYPCLVNHLGKATPV